MLQSTRNCLACTIHAKSYANLRAHGLNLTGAENSSRCSKVFLGSPKLNGTTGPTTAAAPRTVVRAVREARPGAAAVAGRRVLRQRQPLLQLDLELFAEFFLLAALEGAPRRLLREVGLAQRHRVALGVGGRRLVVPPRHQRGVHHRRHVDARGVRPRLRIAKRLALTLM